MARVSLWDQPIASEGQKLDPTAPNFGALPRDARPTGRKAVFNLATAAQLGALQQGSDVVIPLPGGDSVSGHVNLVQFSRDGMIQVGGELTGDTRGSFSLASSRNGQIAGRILLPDQRLAYEITSPVAGEMVMHESDLADVLCYRMPRPDQEPAATPSETPPLAPPILSSRPGATAVLYLDFDGETVTDRDWNSGNTIVAAASALTNAQITEVWNRVKEDYWPFNIDVTTDLSRYNGASAGQRMRVIITPTDTASPGSGGVAYLDSFSKAGSGGFSTTIPCWVFNTSVVGVAEAVSHELGHTLGLHHDGRTSPVEEYYAGQGTSPVSWGPIMGAAYNKDVVQWSKGEYANANNSEDDVAIISGSANGFGYIADEAGDTRATAAALPVSGTSFNQTATISTAGDSDYYRFTVSSAKTLTAFVNLVQYSPNLDALLELQDSAGTTIFTANPDTSLGASLSCGIPAGTYYLRLRGTGRANPSVDGYSNYGSIGFYYLNGSLYDTSEPVAPTIASQSNGGSFYAGTSISLSVSVGGTYPFSFQWRKDGLDLTDGGRISGVTTSTLSLSNLLVGDNGDYTVVVRNAKGSATSIPATLTVTLPAPPVFYSQPSDTTTVEGSSFSLYGWVNSPVSVTYQWYKEGVLLPGMTSNSFSKSVVSLADAGAYQLLATNSGGGTWSRTVTVTVTRATLPSIYTQPQSQDLFTGQYLSLGVSASSNTNINYQWYLNGAAIVGATSSSYYVSSAASGNAGVYTVIVSTPAGSVTSAAAFITVSASLPPSITSQPSSYNSMSLGSSAYLSISAVGMPPLAYQWYHNGAAIPGSTSSYLSVSSVTAADLGEYFITVSNPNGTTTSDTVRLDLGTTVAPGFFWIDAREVDGVVYFLHTIPRKIARFDLATGSWLAPWAFARTPSAFAFAGDSIYVAYGTDIARYDRTLGAETALVSTTKGVAALGVVGNFLVAVVADSTAASACSYDRATGVKIDEKSLGSLVQGYTVSTASQRVFGCSSVSGGLTSLPVQSSGYFGTPVSGALGGVSLQNSLRPMVLADGTRVTDRTGVVYNSSDLTYVGSLGTWICDAISDSAGGFYSLAGTKIYAHDQSYRQIGSASLGLYGARFWRKDNALYAFAQPSALGATPAVQKIDLTQINPPTVASAVDAHGRRVSPARIVLDEDGVLYVYSKSDRNIFRWSVDKRKYLAPIPLSSAPNFLAYSAANHSLYFDGNGSQLKQISLNSGSFAELPFLAAAQKVTALQTAGSFVYYIEQTGYSSEVHNTASAAGAVLSRTGPTFWTAAEYTWAPVNHRMFFPDGSYLRYETIATDGRITGWGMTQYADGPQFVPPIRVSPDGSVLLVGSGRLYDGVAMTYLGSLPTAVVDAAWTTGNLHLLRSSSTGTEVQTWPTSTYQLARSVSFAAKPLVLCALSGDRLLVVTSVDGYLNYDVLNGATLAVISHDDTRQWPLRIVTQPTSQCINQGEAATFVVDADGRPPIAWRWQTSADGGSTWGDLVDGGSSPTYGGTATSSLTIASTTAAMSGFQYRCIASNNAENVASDAAALEYFGRPSIVRQPMTRGVAEGQSAGFTVLAAGLPAPAYQWQISSDGGSSWSDISNGGSRPGYGGATSAGLTITATALSMTNYQYRCVVSNSLGSVTSHTATLVVRPPGTRLPAGDLNGDGQTDVLFQNARTGERGVWLMIGTNVADWASLGTVPLEWQIAGTGDFNGDGQIDILFQNTRTGERGVWLMIGTDVADWRSLGVVPLEWQIAGTADFNGDRQTDILFQNTRTGERGVWLMIGTNVADWASLGTVPLEWQIAGTADFNGDGQTDILWQNARTGERGVWLLVGTNVADWASLGIVPLEWQIAGTGDFNGDGQIDILFQNTRTGERGVWLMIGTNVADWRSLGLVPLEWQIAGNGSG
jgi:hypothetical protein